jgi:outer membrane protein assembly factor BamB
VSWTTRFASSLLWLWSGVAAAVPWGFRGDGTATYADATPPAAWSAAWKAPIGAKGNGSPVGAGGVVFVTAEPSTLLAIDAATGRVRWRRSLDVLDALDPTAQASLRPMVEAAPAWERSLAALRPQYSEALRAARAGTATTSPEALDAMAAQIQDLTKKLAAVRPFRTPPTHDEVGYASPTPLTDGRSVWVLFGHGLVACVRVSGELVWSRWLGVSDENKQGYTGTDAASPVWAAGRLVVPYRNLQALDPATGAVVWTGPSWHHYGTPAVATMQGRTVLVTPDGRVVDAGGGRTLARDLGNLNYTAPTARGSKVWFVGSAARYDESAANTIVAWDLDRSVTEPLYRYQLPSRDRIYSVPLWFQDRLYVATRGRQWLVLDAPTGGVVHQGAFEAVRGEMWAPLVAAGGAVWAASIGGTVVRIDPAALASPRTFAVSPNASTPFFSGSAVYWRGGDALYRFGG